MTILVTGIVLILALLAIKISNQYGIPSLVLFILLGISFTLIGVDFNDYPFSEKFASLALMFIMFYGGYGTKWQMAKPVALPSVILASGGVVLTALITGVFCHFVLGFDLIQAMLLGSIVGSTDFATVSSILKSKKLNLKYSTAPLLEMESGSNDPFAYTMTMIFLAILSGSKVNIAMLVILQITVGILIGYIGGRIFFILLEKIDFSEDGMLSVFMIAAILLIYQVSAMLGGNGFLAVYLFGIYIGNKEYKGKRQTVFFFDGISNIMQIALFFMLGLLSEPSKIISNLAPAFFIMLFMTLIARPIVILLVSFFYKMKLNQVITVTISGIRGAAAIAFAIMAVNQNIPFEIDIFHIVFGICILSTLIQGSLMASVSKKVDMIDPNDSVLKTFNSYQDKSEIAFIETSIKYNCNLNGKTLAEISPIFDIIVAKLIRNGKQIVPKGDTVVQPGDRIIIGGKEYFDSSGKDLLEITLYDNHPWTNKKVIDIDLHHRTLIVMLLDNKNNVVIPTGQTVLKSGDKLVLYSLNDENS